MARQRYGPPRNEGEVLRFAQIVASSFAIPVDAAGVWFAKAGHENLRLLQEDHEVVGGLLLIPMGQIFGERTIPTQGIAGVGVEMSRRGTGLATTLMQRCIKELHRQGTPLSTLYPATAPLYRRAGYDMAGGLYRASIQAADVQGGDRELPLRPAKSEDEPAIRRVYARYARSRNGWLERGPYVWRRTRAKHDGARAKGYVVHRGRRVEGYVFFHQESRGLGEYDVEVTDLAYASPEAARALLRFFSDQRTLAGAIRFPSGPDDGLLSLLRERRHHLERRFPWMLRLVDLPAALGARGYPAGVAAKLDFEVKDDVVRANHGRFTLTVQGGRGEVKPGGRGSLRLDVRALAPLFTGHHSATRLAEMGRLEGSPKMMTVANSVFAGPPPTLADFF